MRREFIINIIFLLGVNLLIKPFYTFGIDRSFQNLCGTSEYGIFFTFTTLALLFQIVSDWGIIYLNSREIANSPKLFSRYFPAFLQLKLLMVLGYFAVCSAVGLFLGYYQQYPLLFNIIVGSQALLSFIVYLRSNIAALGAYRLDSFFSICDKLIMILLGVYFLWIQKSIPITIIMLAWIQFVAYGITLILIAFSIYSFKKSIFLFKKNALVRSLLKKSLPYALVVLFMTIYSRIDIIMIEKLSVQGVEQVGIYASAFRILDISNMFGVLFAGLLLPMFANLLGKSDRLMPLLELSCSLMIIGTMTVASLVFCNRYELSHLLNTHATAYWGDVLGVLIFCFIANGIGNYIFSALLTANNNLKQLAYLYFGGIVLNISLNFSLIPSMNALGAAWAGVITQSTLMIGQIVLAIILLDLKFSLRWLARVGCYISIILFSSVWLTMFSPATFSMTEKGSAIILVSLLSSFILVSPREIIALLRSKDEKTLMH
ncbi:MAG: oligosaccharide flippase family protein [Saprospiraceae bacterium]|nr:oligosaccharide flippase family protein [Saprospiraceae bacterium]